MRIPSPTPYTLLHSHLIDVAPQLPPPLQGNCPLLQLPCRSGGSGYAIIHLCLEPQKAEEPLIITLRETRSIINNI